jgi:signal transduction histidine kinase
VEVALRKERTPHEYEQVLMSNLEEINRMSQIVDDLLLLSRMENGEVRLNWENVNLTEILNEVVSQINLLAQSKNIRIETTNHLNDIYVWGDGLRIRELFLNLIENGIKYTEQGGSIHIFLSKNTQSRSFGDLPNDGEKEFAQFIVSDNGIGIAKEDQKRIFDRFYRVDKARSRDQGGSGLGLSICKWIVEAHKGEITVESELGKGSTFIVKLPINPS